MKGVMVGGGGVDLVSIFLSSFRKHKAMLGRSRADDRFLRSTRRHTAMLGSSIRRHKAMEKK